MKILYLDIDGVLADFDSAIKRINPGIELLSIEERRSEVHRICNQNSMFFENLDLIKGAKDSVQTLSETYDLYFLSTPIWDVPHSYFGKRHWLEMHFGNWAIKRLILTHRKDLMIGDFLVDDRIKHGSDLFHGQFIHFGHAPFENWEKVMTFLRREEDS